MARSRQSLTHCCELKLTISPPLPVIVQAILLQDALLPLLSSLPLPTFTAILSQPWPPADAASASQAGTTKALLVALRESSDQTHVC